MKETTLRMWKRIKEMCGKLVRFLFNPRFLLCFGIGWMLTNGWSYIFLALGLALDIPWMMTVASAYMAFLWFPFTPEKILTLFIALFLLRLYFPNDKATLQVLRNMLAREKKNKG